MGVKNIKLKIIKPIDSTWDEAGKILRDLRYNSSKLLNLTIQKSYEWLHYQLDYKDKNGVYPKDKDVFGCSHRNSIYRVVRERFKMFNSNNAGQTLLMGYSRFNTDKKDILLLRKSIPSFRLKGPIYINNNSFSIKDNIFKVALISKEYAKENDINKLRHQFECAVRDKSTKAIIKRIESGEYKQGFAMIIEKKNHWYVSICYSFDDKVNVDKNEVMGIDLGIVHPLYIALNGSLKRFSIKGNEIDSFRKTVEARKNSLLEQSKYCGDGRKGHGRKTRISPTDFAKEKVSNFRNTTNHKYSSFVIDVAKRNNVGLIQMENLEGISADNSFLKNWSYYDLQQKISYKAKIEGINVKFINPFKTSQMCSKCGYISPENRETQLVFACKECGFETNADYNAAKNISNPDIEDVIKDKCKELGIKYYTK